MQMDPKVGEIKLLVSMGQSRSRANYLPGSKENKEFPEAKPGKMFEISWNIYGSKMGRHKIGHVWPEPIQSI